MTLSIVWYHTIRWPHGIKLRRSIRIYLSSCATQRFIDIKQMVNGQQLNANRLKGLRDNQRIFWMFQPNVWNANFIIGASSTIALFPLYWVFVFSSVTARVQEHLIENWFLIIIAQLIVNNRWKWRKCKNHFDCGVSPIFGADKEEKNNLLSTLNNSRRTRKRIHHIKIYHYLSDHRKRSQAEHENHSCCIPIWIISFQFWF